MITMTLREVAAVTGGRLAADGPEVVVDGEVVIDSRQAGPGTLVAAFVGSTADGHEHVPGALAAGAAGALVSRPDVAEAAGADPARLVVVDDVAAALGRLARHVLASLRGDGDGPRVVAVTGSVGKTTTKDLLAHLLAPLGDLIAPPGSFNNEIGLPLTVLRARPSTATLVLEMGADHVGNLEYLTSVAPPDVAVVLAVGRAHLGEFGGIENVARAKSELVAGLRPTGTAVLNADDRRVAAMAPLAPGPVRTFGRGDADVVATDVVLDDAGRASFTLTSPAGAARVRLALVGEHHVHNALAAAAVALELGLTPAQVADLLAAAPAASPHRMAVTDRADGVRVVDDSYNANPDSVRAGLRALATLGAGRRRVAVLGEMLELGADSAAEHDAAGADAVALGADVVLAVGAGTAPLAAGARRAAGAGTTGSAGSDRPAVEVVEVPDVDAAEADLRDRLSPGDVVLLKGSNGSGIWRLADALLTGTDTRGRMPS
ncbi:UDP-N-acetylmuramoyl-tripeptide--D-alanyl-D-alanine ligase [Georgenia muralis]